jgi:hypothetical protein
VLLVHRHRELLAQRILDATRVQPKTLRKHSVQQLHLVLQHANLVLERARHAVLLGAPPVSCAGRAPDATPIGNSHHVTQRDVLMEYLLQGCGSGASRPEVAPRLF